MDIELDVKKGQKLYYTKVDCKSLSGRHMLKYNITAEGKNILSWKPAKDGLEVSMCGIPFRIFDYAGKPPCLDRDKARDRWNSWGIDYYGMDMDTYLDTTYELHVGEREEITFSDGTIFKSYSDIMNINELDFKRKIRQCVIYDICGIIKDGYTKREPTDFDLAIQGLCESGQIPQAKSDIIDEWSFKPYVSPFYFHPDQNDDELEEWLADYGFTIDSYLKTFNIHNFRVDKALKDML